jgi:N-acetylneuraminate synthase
MEFQQPEYAEIDRYCRELGMPWFASVWDEPSIDFLENFNPICYKVPSASLTDHGLLRCLRNTGRPVILSTGMSTVEQIRESVSLLDMDRLVLAHATSTYPCDPSELNLTVIEALRKEFPCPIAYSGHEVGLITSVVAVALGACMVERHITLDRAMWGSDQAASVEPQGFERLVKYIHVTQQSLGDGVKRVYDSELSSLRRLRRFQ